MSIASTRARTWFKGLGILTVATALANGLSLALSLILSRGLTPAEYGGIAALLAVSVVGSVPAQAEQFLAARHQAADHTRHSVARAWLVAALLVVGLTALAGPLANWLDVGRLDVVLLGLNLAPLTVLGVYLGVLLGAGKQGAFGGLLIVIAGGRVIAAILAFVGGGGITSFLSWALVAAWATLGVGFVMSRRLCRQSWTWKPEEWRPYFVGVSTIAGIYVLTSIDTVAARILLTPATSGDFAVSSLWSRVAFWLPQAIALAVFPLVAAGRGGRRLLVAAVGLVVMCGVILSAFGLFFGLQVTDLTSGSDYGQAHRYIPWQVLIGTLGAILQLLSLHGFAASRRVVEHLVWLVCGAEVIALSIFRPVLPAGIISIQIIVQLVAVGIAMQYEWRGLALHQTSEGKP